MDKMESLNHTKWDCKYHVVFIPKNRRRVLYAELRKYLGEVFRSLALQKGSRIPTTCNADKGDKKTVRRGISNDALRLTSNFRTNSATPSLRQYRR